MYDQLYTHSLNYVSIDYSFSFWGGGSHVFQNSREMFRKPAATFLSVEMTFCFC